MTKEKICKNCKYFYMDTCNRLEIDDINYPHNNSKFAGFKIYANDDTGLEVDLRVNENFGCNQWKEKK